MKQFLIKLKNILQCKVFYVAILVCSLVWSFIYINNDFKSDYDISDEYVIGKIDGYKVDGDTLTIDINGKEKVRGVYYFDSYDEKESFFKNFKLGDKVRVNGKLRLPNNNTILNTFNYKRYLYYNKIYYLIDIESIDLISNSNDIFLKLKNLIFERLRYLDNEYINTFLVGESYKINEEDYNKYKTNGILHLFALSGMHVSVLSGIFDWILNKFKVRKFLSLIVVFSFLVLQAFIASFSASIVRAVLFYLFRKLYKILKVNINSIYIFYLVFSLMIFINPFYLFNIGFQLSFSITYFIIIFSNNFNIKSKIGSLISISLVSFLASLPIILCNYYEVNLLGFINNLFFVPFVTTIVYPLSLITFFFGDLNFIFDFVIRIMELINEISFNVLVLKASFAKFSIIFVILSYIFLYIILSKKNIIICFLYFILYVFLYFYPYSNDSKIYFTDVGQGDSTLIVTGDGTSVLIDTGGVVSYGKEEWRIRNNNFNLMIDSMIPFYKSIGLKKIDYLIISHGDYDHSGYAINLVENFKVKKVIFNCGDFNELENDLIKVLDKKKIPYYSCIKELNINDNKLYFLNNKDYGNENDNSSVIYTELNNYKFLFMGDAGVEVEEDLIKKYNLQDIDVLKVGHHGSKTSSGEEFIDSINPEYSVISVGKNNRYGHPNNEVLENLVNSKIYRTDRDGSVMFKIKNDKLEIETCRP